MILNDFFFFSNKLESVNDEINESPGCFSNTDVLGFLYLWTILLRKNELNITDFVKNHVISAL